jgi:hypothetical protein
MKKLQFGLISVLSVLVAVGTVFAGGAPRVAVLTGAAEVPVPGDPDGSGFAEIILNVGQGTVCWSISFDNIEAPVAAHIHVAPEGVPGPVVVPLSPISGGCTTADPALIQAIIDHPENYYVNVHNPTFPGGAIRGQLSNRGQAK